MKIIQNEDGLTLLELIISMALLSIVAMAMFVGLEYGYNLIATSRDHVEDIYDAQMDSEEMLSNLDFDNAVSSGSFTGTNAIGVTASDIEFEWESSALSGRRYTISGYSLEYEVSDESYLYDSIYIYVPASGASSP